MIEFLVALLRLLKDPCEDVPEQKKKKTIVKDESAFISIIERLFSEASCSPFWSITIDEIPMSRAIDSLKDDEKAWVKWRASGSHGIPKYDSELQVEPVSSDSPCPVDQPSFGFVKCDYSFLGSEASGKMAKPNLSTHLSILKDEDPSDREGLFHDPVSITFMFNCRSFFGKRCDCLFCTIVIVEDQHTIYCFNRSVPMPLMPPPQQVKKCPIQSWKTSFVEVRLASCIPKS